MVRPCSFTVQNKITCFTASRLSFRYLILILSTNSVFKYHKAANTFDIKSFPSPPLPCRYFTEDLAEPAKQSFLLHKVNSCGKRGLMVYTLLYYASWYVH